MFVACTMHALYMLLLDVIHLVALSMVRVDNFSLVPFHQQKFIGDILQSLEAAYNTECYCLCLEALRILSREKHHLYQLNQKEGILLLLKLAGLVETLIPNNNDQGK